ncbi:MAG: HAD-IA family hydrolase [Pseudomonadota bacterium]
MSKLSNDHVAWNDVDTVLLDMDGTLLDLRFDGHFWLEVVPAAYARQMGKPLDAVLPTLYREFDRRRNTLPWYSIEHWSDFFDMDIDALQRKHASNIAWLHGAPAFLDALQASGKQTALVTNADRHTLGIKDEQTGLVAKLHTAFSAHDFGCPKEHPEFWDRFFDAYPADRSRTLFVDDTVSVLESARRARIGHVVAIAQPDSAGPVRDMAGFVTVRGVFELIVTA